jgi:hypothetical protein
MGFFEKMGFVRSAEEVSENAESAEQPKKEKQVIAPATSTAPAMKFAMVPESAKTKAGQIVGEFDEKIYENLSEAIDKNNLPGNDFWEFSQSLNSDSIKVMTVDEKTKFNMVFATLKSAAGGMTKETLVKSVQHYIDVVNKEKEIFLSEMADATEAKVNTNVRESDNLSALVQKKTEQIQKLQEEIVEITGQITTLNGAAEESKYIIAKKQADFEVTVGQMIGQLEGYGQKINQHIQ